MYFRTDCALQNKDNSLVHVTETFRVFMLRDSAIKCARYWNFMRVYSISNSFATNLTIAISFFLTCSRGELAAQSNANRYKIDRIVTLIRSNWANGLAAFDSIAPVEGPSKWFIIEQS